jgi:hypothetical protein
MWHVWHVWHTWLLTYKRTTKATEAAQSKGHCCIEPARRLPVWSGVRNGRFAPTEIGCPDRFAHLIAAVLRRWIVLFAPNATVPQDRRGGRGRVSRPSCPETRPDTFASDARTARGSYA